MTKHVIVWCEEHEIHTWQENTMHRAYWHWKSFQWLRLSVCAEFEHLCDHVVLETIKTTRCELSIRRLNKSTPNCNGAVLSVFPNLVFSFPGNVREHSVEDRPLIIKIVTHPFDWQISVPFHKRNRNEITWSSSAFGLANGSYKVE